MIVRLSTYLRAVRDAAAAQTLAAHLREEVGHLRKENRRLLDVVVAMKRMDFTLHPQHSDEAWEPWTLDEADAAAAAREPRLTATDPNDGAPDPLEQEIVAALRSD